MIFSISNCFNTYLGLSSAYSLKWIGQIDVSTQKLKNKNGMDDQFLCSFHR